MCRLQVGVTAVKGDYRGGWLSGQCSLVMADGTVRQAWSQRGALHGPARSTGAGETKL